MITNVQECIKPISYVKTNAADMMNFVNDKKEFQIKMEELNKKAGE